MFPSNLGEILCVQFAAPPVQPSRYTDRCKGLRIRWLGVNGISDELSLLIHISGFKMSKDLVAPGM